MVDYLLTFSIAIITGSAAILGSFLARYRQLVKQAQTSTSLAKDVWDTMNSRFSVTDARIIDLMAKTEILSSRLGLSRPASPPTSQQPSHPTSQLTSHRTKAEARTITTTSPAPSPPTEVSPTQPPLWEGTETEAKVLRFLTNGPKSSARIKDELEMSREHTARLMKSLFDRGLVVRNDRNKPYVYEITDAGRSHVAS